MKQLLLHIGMHKTGTTTIQHALTGYSKSGTKYASFDEANHSIPMHTIFSKSRADYHIWKRIGLTPSEVDEKRNKYLRILESHVEDKEIHRLIISGEDIGTLSPSEQESLVEWFVEKGIEVKVLALVRSPVSYASSAAQEIVQGGACELPLVRTNYRHRLETFSRILPSESVVVGSYDKIASGKGLHNFYKKQLGLDVPEPKRMNQSRSFQAVCLTLLLNKASVSFYGSPEKMQSRAKLVGHISHIFSVASGCDRCEDKLGMCLDSRAAQEDAAWLLDKFKIDFCDQCGDGRGPSEDSLEMHKYLIGHDSKFRSLFALQGMSFCHDKDLTEQLGALYTLILRDNAMKSSINCIRDIAIKIKNHPNEVNFKDALALMKVAGNLRPDGPLIHQTIEDWSKHL